MRAAERRGQQTAEPERRERAALELSSELILAWGFVSFNTKAPVIINTNVLGLGSTFTESIIYLNFKVYVYSSLLMLA